jgi:hypothetical protein
VTRRRSDGAIVRVVTKVDGSEEEALLACKQFAESVAPQLAHFIPE